MKKRFLAALLCVMLVCTLVTPVAFATGEYDDYVPSELPENEVLDSTNENLYGINTSNVGWGTYDNQASIRKIGLNTAFGNPNNPIPAGVKIAKTANSESATQGIFKPTAKHEAGKTYVVKAKVKSLSENIRVSFAVTAGGSTTYFDNEYGSDGFTPPLNEWCWYKATITPQTVGSYNDYILGYKRSTVSVGDAFLLDLSEGLYVAEEEVYDISAEADTAVVEQGGTVKLSAKVLNQIGMEMNTTSNFTYYAVNEDRTSLVSGFSFNVSSDTKKAEVTVADTVAPGNYVLVAEDSSCGIQGFRKGIAIEVKKPQIKDVTGTDETYEITLTPTGETTLGVFDSLSLSAQIVNKEGEVGDNVQEITNWYIIGNDKIDEVTEGFNLQTDNTTATLSLTEKVKDGTYYIVAESQGGLRKLFEITVNTKNDIKTVINKIKEDTVTKADIQTCISLLGLDSTYVNSADADELANLVIASADEQELTDNNSLEEYLKKVALVALYNIPSGDVALSDENGNFKYASELKLADIDKEGVTLYSGAMSVMSTQGKNALQSNLTQKDFENHKAFMTKLKEELLLTAIQYPAKDGYGYLDSILTEANLKLMGIDASEYLALNNNAQFAQNELVKKEFTLLTLASTLKNAYETNTGSSGGNSDGNSKGNSGGKLTFSGSSENEDTSDENAAADNDINEFSDVPSTHWAYTDIQYLKSIGVINGVTEDSFAPKSTVTREQFLKLLMEAFELYGSNTVTSFKDVDADAWYTPYVNGAVELGIINGKSAELFGIGDAVTRQDACVMIDRALKLSGEVYEEPMFRDSSAISDYAKPAVSVLYGYGVINGMGDSTFAPLSTCTRAQAAKIISSTLSLYNSLNLR